MPSIINSLCAVPFLFWLRGRIKIIEDNPFYYPRPAARPAKARRTAVSIDKPLLFLSHALGIWI